MDHTCNPPSTNKERFLTLARTIRRRGVFELLDWLETTDFYTAPASTRFHGSCPGGLLEHSLNVYDELQRLLAAYPDIRSESVITDNTYCSTHDSAAIISLFHDLCKVNYYTTEKRNRKNELGQWESYNAYTVNEQFNFGGHGSKSVFLIQRFMPLTDEEAAAINSHMGAFADQNVGKVYEQFPLAFLLHVADEAATYIVESK